MNGEKIGAIRIELRAIQNSAQPPSPSMRVRVPIEPAADSPGPDDALGSSDVNTGRWTKTEHKRFMEALKLFGKDWKKVQEYVGTRTTTQARSHAQKYFSKAGREDFKEGEDDNVPSPKSVAPPQPDKSASNTQSTLSAKDTTPPVKAAEELPERGQRLRKRLKGPFKPGRRPIKCDPPLESRLSKGKAAEKQRDEAQDCVPNKQLVTDALCASFGPRLLDDFPESDRSLRLGMRPPLASFLHHESETQTHQWNEKSQLSEIDFDVTPAETIRPLEIDQPLTKAESAEPVPAKNSTFSAEAEEARKEKSAK